MIVRLTPELGKRIGVSPAEMHPLNANPFADWSCHVFPAARSPHIVALNTASLYAVLFSGQRINRKNTFESALFGHLRDQIIGDGFEFLYRRLIDIQGGEIQYSRPLNPVLRGTIADLAELAAHYLETQRLAPRDVAERINTAPLAAIGHAHPRDAFRALHVGA
ncbi:MAG: hypothetical protein KF886_07325 [Candidatus Hydrogenedentes bacterium]|nr:hypothetical protein [Candidatus Hydrogenedentota bacterium]